MSKNHAIIIRCVLPLTTFYRSGAQKGNVYKRHVAVTSWRFHNRAWQPQRHDRLPETPGTLWIPRGALTNQRCSLVTRCGIMNITGICKLLPCSISHQASTWLRAVLFSVVFILSVVLRIRVVCVSKDPSKVFELNLRYFGQRRYRSGQMYWMTFLRPWPCSRLWHR